MTGYLLQAILALPLFPGKARLARYVGALSGPVWVRTPYGPLFQFHPRDATSSYGVVGGGGYDGVLSALSGLTPGMNFIDIGANAGIFSLVAAERIGSDGVCYAFEPSLPIAARLAANAERNGADNIRILPFGISDTSGFLSMASDEQHTGRAHLGEDGTAVLVVDLSTGLPELVEEMTSHPFMVKIDVEGHEEHVLRSIQNITSHPNCRRVVVEIERAFLTRAGSNAEGVYTLLELAGLAPHGSCDGRDHYDEIFDRAAA